MEAKASKYLVVETAMSALCNGILNVAAAWAIFHAFARIATSGPHSLLRDAIGETFLVVSLSILVPTLIARHRRRTGALPVCRDRPVTPGNIYIRSILFGIAFTCVCMAANLVLLPLLFPDGVSLRNVLLFKTIYGAILGATATFLALRRALHEV